MRKLSKLTAALAAVGLWAGAAAATPNIPFDFTNLTSRLMTLHPNIHATAPIPINPCTNVNPPIGLSAPDPGCFVFAGSPGAFVSTATDIPAVMTFLGGTIWNLTVPAPVWEAVLQAAVGVSDCATVNGVCTGSATAWSGIIDASTTGPPSVTPTVLVGPLTGTPTYWNATFFSTILGTAIGLEGQGVDFDRPFYNDLVGNPFTLSCAGLGVPGGGVHCPPTVPLISEPGLIIGDVNGQNSLTAFTMTFNGVGRQVWAPFDFTLNEVPEPGTLLLLGAGITGLALLGRKRTA
jgi:hypothetical protein